jgi:hypothetical protein
MIVGLKGRGYGVGGRLFREGASDLGKWSGESGWKLAPLGRCKSYFQIPAGLWKAQTAALVPEVDYRMRDQNESRGKYLTPSTLALVEFGAHNLQTMYNRAMRISHNK